MIDIYDQVCDYGTCRSSSCCIRLARQRAHSSRNRSSSRENYIRLYRNSHRPHRGRRACVDTLYLNRPMGVFSLNAGKLSFWRVSPLFAGVARQYWPPACRQSRNAFPIYNQRWRNCVDRISIGAVWVLLSGNVPFASTKARLTVSTR